MAASLSAIGLLATALTPLLAARHPALLLALESPIRNLLLTHQLPVGLAIAIATVRRVGGALVYFALGRFYGEDALSWLRRRSGNGRTFRWMERSVRGAVYPMVFFLPEVIVSVAAGAMRLRPAVYLGVSVAGSVTVTLLVRLLGRALAAPLGALLRFLAHHAVPVTLLAAALIGTSALLHLARRRALAPAAVPAEG